ncbi:MAG: hypothetical protein JJU37_15320 [Balneolaceae bacterium]|nr:hypothetical protein [Balneolaceae bacterium]
MNWKPLQFFGEVIFVLGRVLDFIQIELHLDCARTDGRRYREVNTITRHIERSEGERSEPKRSRDAVSKPLNRFSTPLELTIGMGMIV